MSPTGILICCTVPSEAVPFAYLASVCRSLQCLISALTQVGRGGLSFRFAGSVLLQGGRRCRQTSLCVGSTHSVPGTEGLPRSRVCALPVYAAQAPSCSIWSRPCVACGSSFLVFHKSADWDAPAFCAFPTRAAQAARSLTGALSRVRRAFSPPPPQPQFLPTPVRCMHLVFSRDPSGGCRPSRISGSL